MPLYKAKFIDAGETPAPSSMSQAPATKQSSRKSSSKTHCRQATGKANASFTSVAADQVLATQRGENACLYT